jgi:hypothetical protein
MPTSESTPAADAKLTPFASSTPLSAKGAYASSQSLPQSQRVDVAVKRLGDLRAWCRDEIRLAVRFTVAVYECS